jgi:hypothetical protein
MNELAVLVPTRSRPHNIQPIIEAWGLTGGFQVADLIFVIDRDDPKLQDYAAALQPYPQAQRMIKAEWEPLVPKLNSVAVKAAEEYNAVAFMGDDHLPRTLMWAHQLVEDHRMRDRAGIVYGRDGFQDQGLPTWWSVDSRVIKALGLMVPGGVQHLFCDNIIKALGEQADCLAYDPRILVEHMHPVVGKAPMDAQYERVNRMEQYIRDGAAFEAYRADGLQRDAILLADIWG